MLNNLTTKSKLVPDSVVATRNSPAVGRQVNMESKQGDKSESRHACGTDKGRQEKRAKKEQKRTKKKPIQSNSKSH